MTNAEKFKEVFGIEIDCGTCNPYPCNENDCEFGEKCENEPVRPCYSWWDWEFKEPTTENDLEVDCISRFEVTEIINEEWDTDIILDRIEALPSITPQEQKKGHWTHDRANVRCSNCGRGYKDTFGRTSAITYNFCPNCGADMRAESEDKS